MHELPTPTPFVYTMATSQTMGLAMLGSIIKIPPARPRDQPYQELICTESDKAMIEELIIILGENGKLGLLFKQNYVKSLGIQVEHVHPMKFLSTIFSNPQLKTHMRNIFDDYFKRNGFMDGLGPSLAREQEKGKLHQYIPDFAQEINVPTEMIRPYLQTSDWEGLVKLLIEI